MYLSIYAIKTILFWHQREIERCNLGYDTLIEELGVYIIPWHPTSHDIKREHGHRSIEQTQNIISNDASN